MKKLLALLVVAAFLVPPVCATWSIVVVNTRTGEVAVGTASCVPNLNIAKVVPVIVVGKGAGASQAYVAPNAINKLRMWDGIHAYWTPQDILDYLLANDNGYRTRQFGIATFTGLPVTYSGSSTDEGLVNLTGTFGDLQYAIQGNVLTGAAVGEAAELALLATDGDLGQRLMAAMEAARSFGGDGRCSCSPNFPTSCGAPPDDFVKSAHTGCVLLARLGDVDGVCTRTLGCANGEYYLDLNAYGSGLDPDPVLVMQGMYDVWRAGLVGRPDHLLSTASAPSTRLPADGVTRTTVTVRLVDVDGGPLTSGGATVAVDSVNDTSATAGPVTDHGDGTYSFPVTAGIVPGDARFVITAADGVVTATLFPYLELVVDPVTPLHGGRDTVAVTQDSAVALTLNVPSAPAAPYLVLCSASGTDPGLLLGDLLLPLNPDEVLWRSVRNANNFRFRNTLGVLDAAGHAEATFTAPPGLLGNLIGRRLDWAALYFDGVPRVTNPVGFDIVHGP